MITLTDPEEEKREEPRIDKGKGRALNSYETGPARALKRKRSPEQDNVPGPSKKRILDPKVKEGDGKVGGVEEREEEEEGEEEEEDEEDDGEWEDEDGEEREIGRAHV